MRRCGKMIAAKTWAQEQHSWPQPAQVKLPGPNSSASLPGALGQASVSFWHGAMRRRTPSPSPVLLGGGKIWAWGSHGLWQLNDRSRIELGLLL